MKILRRIVLPISIALFLSNTFACGAGPANPAEKNYDQGLKYAVQGKFKEAKEEFEKALKVDPLHNLAESNLSVIMDVLEQKIKKESAIHFLKGISYHVKGQYDQALSNYTKAIEINPRFAKAYYNRGNLYAHSGQYDQALSDYTKAIEINPRLAEAYNNRGLTYSAKGQYNQAISDFTKALKINPRDVEVYKNRGGAYDDKGQYDQALSDYTKAIEINPEYADAYSDRGHVYFGKLKNRDKGCVDFKRACELGECGNYNATKQKGYCP